MAEYDFVTLSARDFERLIRDVLQAELGILLESFKAGPDGGIDFRHGGATGLTVVQVKHYRRSSWNDLKAAARHETINAKRLAPARYILATSFGLSRGQKDALYETFHAQGIPEVLILGCDDVNNLLGKHPSVERQHIKLWLTSPVMLDEILNARERRFSQFELQRMARRVNLFVATESFADALSILDRLHTVVISGMPGIGKTTLADMLILQYAQRGYDVHVVETSIIEAIRLFDPTRQQVFFYDDFLGQTQLEAKLMKNEDRRLLDFVQELANSPSGRLVLTTREYLYQQASREYERLASETIEVSRYIIDLSSYSPPDKDQILFNHATLCGLPDQHKSVLLGAGRGMITTHKNFSPRLVEWATSPAVVGKISPEKYLSTVLKAFDEPSTVWRHAFEEQITEEGRVLSLVLLTTPRDADIEEVSDVFSPIYQAWCEHHRLSQVREPFRRAIKELDGSLVKLEHRAGRVLLDHHNPSIADYLQAWLSRTPETMGLMAQAMPTVGGCYALGALVSEAFEEAREHGRHPPTELVPLVLHALQDKLRFNFGVSLRVGPRLLVPYGHIDVMLSFLPSFGEAGARFFTEILAAPLIQAIERRAIDRDSILRQLIRLEHWRGLSPPLLQDVHNAVQESCYENVNDLEDFESARYYIERFGNHVLDEFARRMRESFRQYVLYTLPDSLNETEDLEELVKLRTGMEEMADAFGASAREVFGTISIKIDEIIYLHEWYRAHGLDETGNDPEEPLD